MSAHTTTPRCSRRNRSPRSASGLRPAVRAWAYVNGRVRSSAGIACGRLTYRIVAAPDLHCGRYPQPPARPRLGFAQLLWVQARDTNNKCAKTGQGAAGKVLVDHAGADGDAGRLVDEDERPGRTVLRVRVAQQRH